MSSSEDIHFHEGTKQSPVAIIILIWKYFINIVRQFWPAIVALLIGRRSSNLSNLVLISVVIVVVSAFVFAVLYYLRFSFKIRNNELLIQKGVFKKSNLNIPFERIQTLNFEQSVIHQIFNVVKIDVDTAGSSKSEFTFNALGKEKAEILRRLVLERKAELIQEESEISHYEADFGSEETQNEIFNLSIKELFVVGLTQNHLRTLVIVFFFCLWGFGELEDAGLNMDWMSAENAEAILQSGIVIVFALGGLLLIGTIIVTIGRTILRYYDYKMYRVNDGFKIQSGLLNRKEYAALDHKVQQIKWINNPLKRLFKIHQLRLKQASSIEVSAKKSIRTPGISSDKVQEVIKYILGDKVKIKTLKVNSIQKDYLYRILLYFSFIPFGFLAFGVWYFTEDVRSLLILLIIPYVLVSAYVAYRKWKYSITDGILYTHHGIFENKNNIMQLFKIQNVEIQQSPYQWRRSLATIKIYTAAGSLHIPYLKYSEAVHLKDYLLYKVESSHEKWY